MEQKVSLATLRRAARISNGYTADSKKVKGHGLDILDGILWAAVTQANNALITRNPDLQHRYATLDEPTPEDLRRPVSIRSIAESLRIPFETTRRRVRSLEAFGLLSVTNGGVISPTEAVNTPVYRFIATRSYEKFRVFCDRLRAIGYPIESPRVGRCVFQPDNPPIRLVMRLSTDFLLRLFATVIQFIGDPALALTLADLIHANSEHLPDDAQIGDAEGPAGCIPDAALAPMRISAIAERLSMPHESMRRYIARLQSRGVCERVGEGYIVPAKVLGGTAVHRYVLETDMHLKHMFSALGDMGVLAAWEAEGSARADNVVSDDHARARANS